MRENKDNSDNIFEIFTEVENQIFEDINSSLFNIKEEAKIIISGSIYFQKDDIVMVTFQNITK